MAALFHACKTQTSQGDTVNADVVQNDSKAELDSRPPVDTVQDDMAPDGRAGDLPGPQDLLVDVPAGDVLADQKTDSEPLDQVDDSTPPDNGFGAGPYGYAPFETAGPFKVATLDGPFDFQKQWSGGQDSYLFLFYHPDYEYSTTLWNSSIKDLLKASPPNVHYFFLSYTNTPLADAEALKIRVDAALTELGATEAWSGRLHLVTVIPQTLVNWLGDFVKSKGYFAFGIDRFQRVREAGLLANVTGSGAGEMKFLAHEAIYFNFEWEREQVLNASDDTVIPLFEAQEFANDGFVEVTLPAASEMATFDTLSFDLTLGCKDNLDDLCGEWDYLVNLYLCTAENPDVCNIEIGRWITAYHRGGRWITEASPVLAFLKEGGKHRFRLNVSGNTYVTSLALRMSNKGKGMRPVAWFPLWTGGEFNLTYNPSKLPMVQDVPDTTKRAEIFALITGHGFGNDTANCAEFCNHTHHFGVNGTEYTKTHPQAGLPTWCQMMVKDGVLPNQYGTWPFGRGGWCPGWDVKPFVADVTSSIIKGGPNTLTYKALYYGNDFSPKPPAEPSGFPGRIDATTYLVLWE